MDVELATCRGRRIVLSACWQIALGSVALADPVYTAVDLGAGALAFGTGGTVAGTTGASYTFNPVQNYLPAAWSHTTKGVPTLGPAPVWDSMTYGNPNNAFSYSFLSYMNSSGLAVGISQLGVLGHQASSLAFVTQMQSNGAWGAPTGIWSGAQTWNGPTISNLAVLGIAPSGQVLGLGVNNTYTEFPISTMYMYDPKTQSVTNLTNLVDSMKWTTSSRLPLGADPNWMLQSPVGQLDDQGRILVQATKGYGGPVQNVLLIPEGVPADPRSIPEPATWVVFATLIGGWMVVKGARKRLFRGILRREFGRRTRLRRENSAPAFTLAPPCKMSAKQG